MRDILLDIVKHTVPLSAFVTLRIDGTDASTEVAAAAEENMMVLRGKTHLPVPEFKGTFGIPNIGVLNAVLNIPEYTSDTAKFSVTTQQKESGLQPAAIHLENTSGDFTNDFRLMASNVIETIEKKPAFTVKTWPISFVPTLAAQQRLKYQSSGHPEEKLVMFRVENGTITAKHGDASAHSGSFTFQSGVDSKIKKTIQVPVTFINAVFALQGDKTIHMGDLGIMISVDSGLAQYDYIFPMQTK